MARMLLMDLYFFVSRYDEINPFVFVNYVYKYFSTIFIPEKLRIKYPILKKKEDIIIQD